MDNLQTKIQKAKQLRFKKPIVKELNIEHIKLDLYDIQDECEEVRWYTDSDNGEDSLLNALLGDEDEAYEFKMTFADLCAECERMLMDLEEEWVPECFDILFVSIGAGAMNGGLLGYDSYEQDYYGLCGYDIDFAVEEATKKLKKMTKDELILATRQCFRVYTSYIGLRTRYDNLKAAMDILKDKNSGHLRVVKEIERLYEQASEVQDKYAEYSKEWREFERFTNALPQEMWLA